MEYDPLADHEQAGKSASRGRLRTFLAQLNPFSSYWTQTPEDSALGDSRAQQEAEVEAGRPRDDYMMTLDVIGGIRHRGPRFQRWALPTIVVVFGLAISLSFVDHRLWGWLMALQILVVGAFLVVALQAFSSMSKLAGVYGARGRFRDAADLLAKGDAESAIDLVKSAIAEKPRTMAGRMFLVDTYCHLGRCEAAALVAQEAVEMFPRHPWPRQRLGQVYAAQRMPDEAIREYEKAARLAGAAEGLHSYRDEALKAIEEIKKSRHP